MSDFTVQVSTSPNVPVVNAVLTTPTIDGKQSTPTKATALDVLAGKTLSGTGNIILSDSPAITTKLTVGGADILAADAVALASRGQVSGLATLDSGGKLAQGLPSGVVLTTPVIDGVASSAAQATALASLANEWGAQQQAIVDAYCPGLEGYWTKLGQSYGGETCTYPAGLVRSARDGGGLDVSALNYITGCVVTNMKTRRWAVGARLKFNQAPSTGKVSGIRLLSAGSEGRNITFGAIYDSTFHDTIALEMWDLVAATHVSTGVPTDLNFNNLLLVFDTVKLMAFVNGVHVVDITDLSHMPTDRADIMLMVYGGDTMVATHAGFAYEQST